MHCDQIGFEPNTDANARLVMVRNHCYELLWDEAPDVHNLSEMQRRVTLITGGGSKAKTVAQKMCSKLGHRLCTETETLPSNIETDVVFLRYLDDMEILHGLQQGLAHMQAVALSGKMAWIVTIGTQRPIATHPKLGGLWGLARSARAEYPDSQFAVVDVSADLSDDALASLLCREVQLVDVAPEIVLTCSKRLRPRFVRLPFRQMRAITFDPQGVYVITGGTGSLGLLTARRMVELGAAKIALLSRTSRAREDVLDAWTWLQACPAQIVVRRCDVSDSEACRTTLGALQEELRGRIRGIVHAEGRADAAPLAVQTQELMVRTCAAKVLGAWNIHLATIKLKLTLQFFVLFSSVSAIFSPAAFGAVGYASANPMLDTLSHVRCAQGLPATSIQWGAWSEAGLAARHDGVVQMLDRCGIQSISSEVGLSAAISKLLYE